MFVIVKTKRNIGFMEVFFENKKENNYPFLGYSRFCFEYYVNFYSHIDNINFTRWVSFVNY